LKKPLRLHVFLRRITRHLDLPFLKAPEFRKILTGRAVPTLDQYLKILSSSGTPNVIPYQQALYVLGQDIGAHQKLPGDGILTTKWSRGSLIGIEDLKDGQQRGVEDLVRHFRMKNKEEIYRTETRKETPPQAPLPGFEESAVKKDLGQNKIIPFPRKDFPEEPA